ncbi:uncharacterized protein LOC6726653 [Drosophila simulans]|uniref:uncharacterized protein LOC6726653 n=1 Tax=Drosophila simulans TaxID=7240 RepID=UPI00078AE16C|nr:uncharacterized protein LOC6726653 [Drosophila simulans]KMZ01386.1 uncharacterized protein Dsimw501_GD19708, isoform B [Drosophila simulans]KMZ01387.1 uncharacterized protein Dsimw501_GD19708, isoform C [Drosophila simulans]
MRTFLILSLLALARGQYDYTPVSYAGNGHGGLIGAPSTGAGQLSEAVAPASELTKEFFSYSAPEHEFDDHSNEQIAHLLKKNLRVLFIKGPDNKGLEQAALQLATSASADRTAIYVLNKQADVGEWITNLNTIRNNNSRKPEVHFVKYRTQSDAENAQRTIQAQYDLLPGVSTNYNGGSSVPVLDFASRVISSGTDDGNAVVRKVSQNAPSTSPYLPPSREKY